MMKYENIPPIAVGATEAARLLGISKPTLYNWSQLPGFPAVRIGGTLRFPVKELREWMGQQAKIQGGIAT